MRSLGRTTPSSSAAAARITLKVEPGSNGSVTARLRQESLDRAARRTFGLNVGRMAMASTSPVRGSRTTVIPDLEPALDTLEPNDLRRQLAVRIQAEGLGQQAEPGLAERPDLAGDRGRELPPQPDERARARQGRVHLAGRQAEDRRQPRRDAFGI